MPVELKVYNLLKIVNNDWGLLRAVTGGLLKDINTQN